MVHKPTKIQKGELILPGYKIKLIHHDTISKTFSFFKENLLKSKISEERLNIKKQQFNKILEYAWNNHNWDRIKASTEYLQFFNRIEFNGLESGFLCRMKQDPRDDYLIINRNGESEFINIEQIGIISAVVCPNEGLLETKCSGCQDRETFCEKWINDEEGGRKFRSIINESYRKNLSQENYDVFINPGKMICHAFNLKNYEKNISLIKA